jgi:transcriptional regulator with XRE-family HTH domain
MNAHDDALKILGDAIRQRRRGLNLSQDELAHRSGLHRTYLSDVERGRRNISFLSLVAIASGLGVTVSELTTTLSLTKSEDVERGGAAAAGTSTIGTPSPKDSI